MNNTVTLELEKYDSIMDELRALREFQDDITIFLEDKIVFSKDDFSIVKEYEDEDDLVLALDANIFRIIKEHFNAYDFEIKYPNAKISRYALKITEKSKGEDE